MVNGGFGGPAGLGEQSSARALSASPILPTFSFAALGTVTVLLVALMGMSPIGSFLAPTARDGGWAVTTPRMSVSLVPPSVHRSAPTKDLETGAGGPPTVSAAVAEANVPAGPVATVAVATKITSPTKVAVAVAVAVAVRVTLTVVVAPPPAAGSRELEGSAEPAIDAGGVEESFGRMQIFAEAKALMAKEGPRRAPEQRRSDKTGKPAKGDRGSKAQGASNADHGPNADKGSKADQGSKAQGGSKADQGKADQGSNADRTTRSA